MLTLLQHIPLHIVVAAHRALISYEGQRTTCYGCNETGHLYQVSPHRSRAKESEKTITTTWADVAARVSVQAHGSTEDMEVGTGTAELEPQPAEDHSKATQRGGASWAREEYDQTPVPMQITAINGEDTRIVTYITMLQESAVDNMDVEGEAVRAKEGTAEGQTSVLRRTNGGESSFETGRDGKLRRQTRAGQLVDRVLILCRMSACTRRRHHPILVEVLRVCLDFWRSCRGFSRQELMFRSGLPLPSPGFISCVYVPYSESFFLPA